MILEFRIAIAPDNGNMRFTLHCEQPGIPLSGKDFTSLPINLAANDLNELRLGNANPVIVQNLTAAVSQWLLGAGIEPYLLTALGSLNGTKLRVILSVNNEELLEQLSDVPFELCTPSGAGMTALVLNKTVEAVVHLLPKVGTLQPLGAELNKYPLRILLVRSNPTSLGGKVPAADEMRTEIFQLLAQRHELGAGDLQIDVLSQEANASGKPTFENLVAQLQKAYYHILIYLGHGDVSRPTPESPSVGVLQMEAENGADFRSVPASQFKDLLHNYPVPVVLLIGCLTAVGDLSAEMQQAINTATPAWMRGSQAVAQTLINSISGVQTAVGMRYKLENTHAQEFLKGFFESLLVTAPGNIETAVHAARWKLRFYDANSYSWSAPMLFSCLSPEPLFPFLVNAPETACPNTEQQQNLRSIFWKQLSTLAWNQRAALPGAAEVAHQMLSDIERTYIESVLAKTAYLILPGCVEGRHEQTVTVPVSLFGQLGIEELRGELVFSGGQIRVKSVEPTPELLQSGYRFLAAVEENSVQFTIERKATVNGNLPAGILFNVAIELGQVFSTVYPASINLSRSTPKTAICTGNNAVIVPPP